jgi:hypothetical protein
LNKKSKANIRAQIGLEISYAPAFTPSASPITISNLAYERAAVLFNLAALYSQLAANEDRSTHEGVKRASVHFQVGRFGHASRALLICALRTQLAHFRF